MEPGAIAIFVSRSGGGRRGVEVGPPLEPGARNRGNLAPAYAVEPLFSPIQPWPFTLQECRE